MTNSEHQTPKVIPAYERKFIVLTPETLIHTPGFIDKYLCNTIKESIKSIDEMLKINKEWKAKT